MKHTTTFAISISAALSFSGYASAQVLTQSYQVSGGTILSLSGSESDIVGTFTLVGDGQGSSFTVPVFDESRGDLVRVDAAASLGILTDGEVTYSPPSRSDSDDVTLQMITDIDLLGPFIPNQTLSSNVSDSGGGLASVAVNVTDNYFGTDRTAGELPVNGAWEYDVETSIQNFITAIPGGDYGLEYGLPASGYQANVTLTYHYAAKKVDGPVGFLSVVPEPGLAAIPCLAALAVTRRRRSH